MLTSHRTFYLLILKSMKVRIELNHLPKDANGSGVCLVPGEQKPALLTWAHEPRQTGLNPFDERISAVKLRSAIL